MKLDTILFKADLHNLFPLYVMHNQFLQSYKLLLEQLPLPSFNILRITKNGDITAFKAITVLLQKNCVSSD